jgi:hypothetical protein
MAQAEPAGSHDHGFAELLCRRATRGRLLNILCFGSLAAPCRKSHNIIWKAPERLGQILAAAPKWKHGAVRVWTAAGGRRGAVRDLIGCAIAWHAQTQNLGVRLRASTRARARAREAAGNQRPWPADKVERWAIDRLIPYAKNARTHTDAQVAAIAASIKEWGWTTPALVGEDGGLIAGHARVLAARQLGIAEIPVMVATGWSEAQKRAYVLADRQAWCASSIQA